MDNCIFCEIVSGKSRSWKVDENEGAYAFLDINPVSKYHTLVIPKTHYKDIFEITPADMAHTIELLRTVARQYNKVLDIQNIQIISSNGVEAQQDVFHLHFHIVPRTLNDGQNIKWKIHPEWRVEFNDLLQKLI